MSRVAREPAKGTFGQRRAVGRSIWILFTAFAAGVSWLVWWTSAADTREIQTLPSHKRLPLYQRTRDNLRDVCDPAATRALREFCREEAVLLLRFRECTEESGCQELARRHLRQPRR